ncbi:DNA alkylation repair protein [Flavobacterium agrisoli]|uniref:DNA alkylation repair protein n=1 Tax=Flavobacterium agrisoli TaxID=2793066 RepID=A0A934PMC9_9FLAO|nr:DNA alkylation repair protein [Flavobacterium agrisoli]MBK0369028.1 DNA alkylation repair protein [Flavobacterium agrisoli]
MALIKDIYSDAFYIDFAQCLSKSVPNLDQKKFVNHFTNPDFKAKEWKERMLYTTSIFHQFLPKNFTEAVAIIETTIIEVKQSPCGKNTLAFMFFPDYIEKYGQNDFDVAVKAFENITQFISCEFAVRPFILKYPEKMIAEMIKWSLHENHHVRRLASEGSRPRLPWAMALPFLKKDPRSILPILENLKNDSSEYVRKSVANNLNDISKDNPEIVLEIAQKWHNFSPQTNAIIKHGCRTLLKQGDPKILSHYELDTKNIALSFFEIDTPLVKIGDSLQFQFTIENLSATSKTIRLEYAIYYQKSKGHLAKKVFKISERTFVPNQIQKFVRKQSFKIITTRVFHPGLHQLSIIINGKENEVLNFELIR